MQPKSPSKFHLSPLCLSLLCKCNLFFSNLLHRERLHFQKQSPLFFLVHISSVFHITPEPEKAMLAAGFQYGVVLAFILLLSPVRLATLSFPGCGGAAMSVLRYRDAPDYRNAADCPVSSASSDPTIVHVAMTLDLEYLRGSIAAVHSVLRHTSCPESVFFHFVAAEFDPISPRVLTRIVRSTFPSLVFKVYIFREDTVINLISGSVRQALENPLNYARNYLGDILDPRVERVIYLDSDLVVVDDVGKLWEMALNGSRVIGAPEYCHANFTSYFTEAFWSDPELTRTFGLGRRKPCYFNTGVMVMDLAKWRQGNYRRIIENWMDIQKRKRIYELGSLPPFLLVFGGNVEPIDHRWNQHGLGGDNVKGSCRPLHPGPVSLLHWSGKGKPWVRLDSNKPCPLDHLWHPYDLYKPTAVNPGSGSSVTETLIAYSSYLSY